MGQALESATILGDADSPKLVTRQTESFSWVRQQMTPQMNFQQQQPQLSLSDVRFADDSGDTIKFAYDDFMKVVFNDLKNEEVGVVPVADLSRYYVVQVVERNPTPEVGEDALRLRFLSEGKRFTATSSPVISMVRQAVGSPVAIQWEKELWLKYGIDPEAPEVMNQ
jgi:hypothetical protein